MGILTAILRWLTGGLASALLKWREAELSAQNETQRQVAQAAIKDIERQMAQQEAAKEIRLATAGFWEMRALTATIAGCFAFHLLLVTLDTCFRLGWRIPAFPKPFDEWQGAILLSFFGVQAVSSAVGGIAAAIRGRR